MKALFLAATAAFAAIPGLGIIASGLGTPPGTGYKWLFGGVIETLGGLALVLLLLNQKKLKRRAKRKITYAAIIMVVVALVFIGSYVLLFRHTVVEHPRGTAYYPLWLSGNIKRMVERAGSRETAIERYGIAPINGAIDEMGNFPLALTTILLLFVYQGIFTSLSVAFGLAGSHMGQPLLGSTANAPPSPPAPAGPG